MTSTIKPTKVESRNILHLTFPSPGNVPNGTTLDRVGRTKKFEEKKKKTTLRPNVPDRNKREEMIKSDKVFD